MQPSNYTPVVTQSWRGAWIAWGILAGVGMIILLGPVFMPVALAQVPTPLPVSRISDDQVNAIAKEMYCPVCESTPLDVCPTQACTEWRELIRQMLAEGQSEAEIKGYFVDRFGPQVLAAPPAEGLNLLIYVVPPVIILAGVLLLYGAFRSWRRTAQVQASPKPPVGGPSEKNDEYVRRMEDELRKQ